VTGTARDGVRDAVAAARRAQPGWAALGFEGRATVLKKLARTVVERRAEAAAALGADLHRAEADSLLSEVVTLPSYVSGAVAVARKALEPERVRLSPIDFPGKRVVIEAVPRGVVGVISPWNYPLLQIYKPLFPALLAGNAVVIKPSEHAPAAPGWFGRVCADMLPSGLVGVVQGDGSAGAALVEADIDALVFTGSVPTGRRVAARAAERLIPCSIELGGKDAAIVLPDADLDRTVPGLLFGALHNAGQDCSSIERVIAVGSAGDALVARLCRAMDRLRVGPGEAEVPPLQNESQRDLVERHIAAALNDGAVLVTGGGREGAGLGIRPTLLDRCRPGMAVVDDETFGPVLAVLRAADEDEAVALANACRYGLNGSVWTADLARGEALARRLHVGVALVNNHSFTGVIPSIPWTGTGQTGPGVAGSVHAYGVFARRRTVVVDRSRAPEPYWFPVDADLHALAEGVGRLGLGAWSALLGLVGALGRRKKSTTDIGR
jgi:acyl-CoA reductase-like NAD-dependent aldehyde dehydrogenase